MVDENSSHKWNLHQVFVQANLIKGYRYLDLSGIVLNRISNLYKEFGIDPGGCLLQHPKDAKDPYAIRFSPDRIWLRYVPIESLAYVIDTAPEWINSIAKDIEVSKFSRLGLRSEFFLPCTNIAKASTFLTKRASSEIIGSKVAQIEDRQDVDTECHFRVRVANFIAAIRLRIVKIIREPTAPIDYDSDGLIFDVDIYLRKNPPEGIPRAHTRRFLTSATELVYDLLKDVAYNLVEGLYDAEK